ncbi:MAG: ABC transporter ATP-binding protein [Myxococcales bacterium]
MSLDARIPPVVELVSVTKQLGHGAQAVVVLRGASLAIAEGTTAAVRGPSGSGKTTLLLLMAGLDQPTEGSVRFRGEAIEAWSEDQRSAWRRGRVGFVFQDFRLLPRLTALENVALPLELLGRSPREARARATELLGGLGLARRLDHLPAALSGGEQQRTAIARAFAHEPDVVFADEPTGNLDPRTAGEVLDQLLATVAAHGTTLVTVTHDEEVAGRMQRQIRIVDGRIA